MTDGGVAAPDRTIRLVLARHAETAWVTEDRFQGRLDPPLTERGRRQAELLAERLADRRRRPLLLLPASAPGAVWHSPLSRARSTAEIVASLHEGVPVTESEDLIEISAGAWEGRLNSEVAASDGERLAAWRHDPTTAHPPGGETVVEAGARVARATAAIVRSLRGSPDAEPWAIVIAHGGILRLVLLDLLELPYARFWSLPFSVCGITLVELRSALAVLHAHNLVDHLAPLLDDPGAAEESRRDRRSTL